MFRHEIFGGTHSRSLGTVMSAAMATIGMMPATVPAVIAMTTTVPAIGVMTATMTAIVTMTAIMCGAMKCGTSDGGYDVTCLMAVAGLCRRCCDGGNAGGYNNCCTYL